MSGNDIIPFYHQRSHSVPVRCASLDGDNGVAYRDGASVATTSAAVPPGYPRMFKFKSKPSPLIHHIQTSSTVPSTLANTEMMSQNREETHTLSRPLMPHSASYSIAPVTADPLMQIGEQFAKKQPPNFFLASKNILTLFDYDRKIETAPVELNCAMDKGFFTDDNGQWTCYRRNYFQITATCIIRSHIHDIRYGLQLNDEDPMQSIRKFFLRLSAAAYSETQCMIKPVGITQMTALRDKGPQREPPLLDITPTSSDTVAVITQSSNHADNDDQELRSSAMFNRLQFKSATANNGKRKAAQQFYRLKLELVVELEDHTQHVVSECYSSPVIVRGRSPGHYSPDDKRLVAYHQDRPGRQRKRLSETDKKNKPAKNSKDVKRKKKEAESVSGNSNESSTITSGTVTNQAADNFASRITSAYQPSVSTSPSSPSVHAYNKNSPYGAASTVSSPSVNHSLQATISTLPPPQYMYATPPMLSSQEPITSNNNTTTPVLASASLPYGMYPQYPLMSHSAFSNIHVRSQSANDCDTYHRYHNPSSPLQFQSMLNNYNQHQQYSRQQQQQPSSGHSAGFLHPYTTSAAAAAVNSNRDKRSSEQVLENTHNWQQPPPHLPYYANSNSATTTNNKTEQQHHNRTDSAATFESFMSTPNVLSTTDSATTTCSTTNTNSSSESGGHLESSSSRSRTPLAFDNLNFNRHEAKLEVKHEL